MFCREVLPHLRVRCLSIYNVKWSTRTCEAFKKGFQANQYVEELEFVYLKGKRAQYFRRDQLILRSYLKRNRCMHQVWDIVRLAYDNKEDPMQRLLEKLTELSDPGVQEDQELESAAFDFIYHLVRNALANFVVSVSAYARQHVPPPPS